MWNVKMTILSESVHKFTILESEVSLTYAAVIRYWQQNPQFRDFYLSILEDSPFHAYFWENPPVTITSLQQTYEFVLVNSPLLATVRADPQPFQARFTSDALVVAFENLGRDAELIIPCPIVEEDVYAHLAVFLRRAPQAQKQELLLRLGESLNQKINLRPTWVSTSGLGVSWLHMRLDTRPKYYSYQPYRQF